MLRIILLAVVAAFIQCGSNGSHTISGIEEPALSQAKKADFCYMLDHPQEFDGKEIETSAILVAGFESAFMYDAACIDKKRSVWFDIGSEIANSQLGDYLGKQSQEFIATGLERVRGNFTGTFRVRENRGFGHMNLSEYRFVIIRVDELSYVPAETPFPW